MDIFRFLEGNGIAYERCDHPAVFTCEEADRLVPPMEGAKIKNLFVRDKKGRRHFLVVVGYEKNVDLKSLSSIMGLSSLTMASPDRLKRYLGVDPGSVTILAVINDQSLPLPPPHQHEHAGNLKAGHPALPGLDGSRGHRAGRARARKGTQYSISLLSYTSTIRLR